MHTTINTEGWQHGEVSGLCRRAGISRQNYYACRKVRQRQDLDQALIVEQVQKHRCEQPRLGTRKLHFLLRDKLAEHEVKVGRDRFFAVLRAAGLLIKRKRGKPYTTNSRHSLPVFRNLLKSTTVERPNQVWASDLTYIRTDQGFLYAALITDVYSRKIVGYHMADTLEAEGCIAALKMALRDLPEGKFPIHHSDRGSQYCCHDYVDMLRTRKLPVSMTEVQHCYENALAERMNGILKQEYEMDRCFRSKDQAKSTFKQAVWLYNHRRPHTSLSYGFPAEVHGKSLAPRGETGKGEEPSPSPRPPPINIYN